MNKEKQEQLKIILLGIIAVVLIIQTGMKMSSKNNAAHGNDGSTEQQAGQQSIPITVNPGQQSITAPVNPGQQSITVPANAVQLAVPTTTMVFEQKDVNIGTVNAGTKASHTFKVTNRGNNPLTFNNVQGDPGISIISWPSAPIPQGGTAEIKVEFDAGNASGFQQKIVHVAANTEPPHEHLTISADVK